MSWKGISKAVARGPQNFKQKFNMGERSADETFEDAERRLKELESQTKKLNEESKRYFTAITSMLTHQIEFSKGIEQIYKPISGQVSEMGPSASSIEEGQENVEGIQASEQYREIAANLLKTLQPELSLIESKIVQPTGELLSIIEVVNKVVVKRAHKQLDLDRRTASAKKYQGKTDLSIKDEKHFYTAENNLDIAQQEYEYYNNMLKEELPRLFLLESEFIRPLFISFYYMQLNVFYILYNNMENMKIPYFDLSTDIVEAYNLKKGQAEARADALTITHFITGRAKASFEKGKQFRKPLSKTDAEPGSSHVESATPPPYESSNETQYSQYSQDKKAQQQYQPSSKPPLPEQIHHYAPQPEYCTALYDYVASNQGDISFRVGDRIQVIQRTENANEWWIGVVNGVQGVFPGNYVQLG
ncbi:reduced viability upon starvation protein [Nadsonia fulvescens var. elongata DSM 6958]|uniref:Reduced viability upon starvation protein n=1 Tax=Nadsonia fulvescens var. elongata DSM 6958 TaxID=857566 RepID=A0A1E3PUB4_9ASCO|nr:reduced viability upon starvation protein [Nadsonia fulvescens var. elongata DSM 6958]